MATSGANGRSLIGADHDMMLILDSAAVVLANDAFAKQS
jgi:hypothetical protein